MLFFRRRQWGASIILLFVIIQLVIGQQVRVQDPDHVRQHQVGFTPPDSQ